MKWFRAKATHATSTRGLSCMAWLQQRFLSSRTAFACYGFYPPMYRTPPRGNRCSTHGMIVMNIRCRQSTPRSLRSIWVAIPMYVPIRIWVWFRLLVASSAVIVSGGIRTRTRCCTRASVTATRIAALFSGMFFTMPAKPDSPSADATPALVLSLLRTRHTKLAKRLRRALLR